MKRLLIISISVFAALLGIACGSNDSASNNVNKANTATPAASPTANANSNANANGNTNVNSNSAEAVKDEPVPTFTDAQTALDEGNKYLDKVENDKAIEAFKQATKLNPDLAEAHFKLGIAYSQVENDKEAEVNQKIDPDATPTPKLQTKKVQGKLVTVGPETNSEKAFKAAVAAYKKILAKNPKDDVAHFNLGRSYNKLNDDKEAEKSLRQAVRLKPDDSQYNTELGSIMIKLAKYDEALGFLKKALKLDETNSQAEFLIEKAQAGKRREEYGKPKDAPATTPKK